MRAQTGASPSLMTLDLQAKDSRFINACVEFDSTSLMPTYRLLWGMPGESQALTVAHGLGFDRDIVAAARQIAADPKFTAAPGADTGIPSSQLTPRKAAGTCCSIKSFQHED